MNNPREIESLVAEQYAFFATNATKPYSWRRDKLALLRTAIISHESDILAALQSDLHKPPFEGYESELGMVLDELRYAERNLARWMRPRRVSTGIVNFPASSLILSEPYGVVLIMAPWNYPFLLSMEPLIGAIAAGNCFVLKPSKDAPATARVMTAIIEEVFDNACGAVVTGGREENKNLLDQPFDYIFFTGGQTVGHVVMDAAAKNLTPVTLELGGKSPCIVDETAVIPLAARRIVWGKYLNAGQTCVAPDYILVHERVKERFIKALEHEIHKRYGSNPLDNLDYVHIVNGKHYQRLMGLLDGADVIVGGQGNPETRAIAPTVIDNVSWDDPLMEQEIFGPLMPLITYESLDDIIARIKARPKPLALYLFTTNKEHERQVLTSVSYGGGCVNDTIVHLASTSLPFGGVGASGMGNYHGDYSFKTFSHEKSIVRKSNVIDIPLRYPPYRNHLSLLRRIMR